jgi:protein SCO1/2
VSRSTSPLAPAVCTVAALAMAVLAMPAPAAWAQRASAPARPAPEATAGTLPEELEEVGFDQRLGERVPLDLTFREADGSEVRLSELVDDKPVILSLVYYECPMLCDLTLSGLAQSLKALEMSAGDEFDVVTVSFDPGEGPEVAAAARRRYLPRYGRTEASQGWHFLTGDEAEIRRLADAVGFRYAYDAESDEYAHAAGIVMLTPGGEVSRYFFGTDHPAKDLRLGLVESGDGKIGSAVDRILLYCFHYDPVLGRYSAATMNLVRAGGIATVLALALFIVVMLRRERRSNAPSGDAPARTA